MKRLFTRDEIQAILETNLLNADVSYMDRENKGSPDNVIIFYRQPTAPIRGDDTIHIQKASIQVNHYHKKKLDSIEKLMLENFSCEPYLFAVKQLDTDYWGTYYVFYIFIPESGW